MAREVQVYSSYTNYSFFCYQLIDRRLGSSVFPFQTSFVQYAIHNADLLGEQLHSISCGGSSISPFTRQNSLNSTDLVKRQPNMNLVETWLKGIRDIQICSLLPR